MKRYYIEYLQPMKLFIHANNKYYFQDLAKYLNKPIEEVKKVFKWGKENGLIHFEENRTTFDEIPLSDEEWEMLISNIESIPYPKPKIPNFYEMFEKRKS